MDRIRRAPRYLASLPERSVRAGAALTGGLVKETAEVAVPDVVRRSKLYQATIDRLVRIMVEGIGDVRDLYPAESIPVGQLMARKAAGNVVEFASIFAVGFSPLWVLAAASDVLGGSREYLRTLAAELQTAQLLPADADVDSYEELISRLETSSGVLADMIDVPPLRLEDARLALSSLRDQTAELPGPDELAAVWSALRATAEREGVSAADLSAALAVSAARAGWQVGDRYVFDFYRRALADIAADGLLRYLRRAATPYVSRAGDHFLPNTATYTDRAFDWIGERRK